MILDLYENDSKTLRVYKETYRKTHKLSGKVNPVYQFRIKVKRGLKWSCFLGQVCGLAKMHLVCVHAAFRVSAFPKYAMSGVRLSRAV